MASHSKMMETKDGRRYFKVSVYRGRGLANYVTRWYVPEEKIARKKNPHEAINKLLAAFELEFEKQCKAGEVLNRAEKAEKAAAERAEADRIAAEEAKIKSFRRYAEDVYMPAFEIRGSAHTINNFRGMLQKHILPEIGDCKLPDLKAEQISALLTKMQQPVEYGGKGLKATTCQKAYCLLKLILTKAYLEGQIDKNIIDFVARPKGTKTERAAEVEYFTREEAQYIQECLKKEPLKWQAYVMLSLDTGARKGELCGLRWRNINLDTGSVTIKETVNYTPDKGVYIDTPKNGKERTIPTLSPETIAILREYKAEQKKDLSVISVNGFVFTAAKEGSRGSVNKYHADAEEPMRPDSPTRWLKRFAQRYGIERCNPHKFRHTFGTNFYNATKDLKGTSEIMGHSDTVITSRYYVHADKERQLSSMEKYLQYMRSPEAKTAEG